MDGAIRRDEIRRAGCVPGGRSIFAGCGERIRNVATVARLRSNVFVEERTQPVKYCYQDTPIGTLLIAGDDAIREIHFPRNGKARRPQAEWTESQRGTV